MHYFTKVLGLALTPARLHANGAHRIDFCFTWQVMNILPLLGMSKIEKYILLPLITDIVLEQGKTIG